MSRKHHKAKIVLCVAGVATMGILMSGCDSEPLPSEIGASRIDGTWGGDGIRLCASHDGIELLYDCAEGMIQSPIVPDTEGNFDLEGTYVPTPGPVPEGGREGYAARHLGVLTGNTMMLEVTLKDTGQSLGTFELRFGDQGRVVLCR